MQVFVGTLCVCVSTGKTLSYAVPVVQSLQAYQPRVSRCDGPLAVVIIPTREVQCDLIICHLQLSGTLFPSNSGFSLVPMCQHEHRTCKEHVKMHQRTQNDIFSVHNILLHYPTHFSSASDADNSHNSLLIHLTVDWRTVYSIQCQKRVTECLSVCPSISSPSRHFRPSRSFWR